MESESSTSTMAKLKLAGAFTGVLEVELENWTVSMLREEVGKRSDSEPKLINLICGGKILKDGDGIEKLKDLGIKNNSKILVTKVSTDQADSLKKQFMAEEERSRLLDRIKAAAVALSERHAEGSLPVEDFNIELEDQSGQKVHLGSETERRGVMMGLMLHANAKHFIKKQMYKEALDVLAMGEEAFSFCDPKFLAMIDNVPILQIDTVWCYFMLRDIKWLSMAGVRLAKAREGIERCHGKDCTRVRMLQGGCHPELALYLRLELLEGVVAYHSEQFEKSRKALTSAQAKYIQLQVPDEALSFLMGMGYKEKESKRALRMNKQDVERAVGFLLDEKEKKAQRREEDFRRQMEILEQKRYGTTPLKKAVNIQRLNELVSIGFEKPLAAEALRRNENDTQKALDDLTNPETNSNIQLYIDSRSAKRLRQANNAVTEELVSMGFERSRVAEAVQASGTREQALNLLTAAASQVLGQNSSDSFANTQNVVNTDSPNIANTQNVVNTDTPNIVDTQNIANTDAHDDGNAVEEGPSSSTNVQPRDVEMEDAIAKELNGDAYADYDIEVTKEGEAIAEYLALLASAESN